MIGDDLDIVPALIPTHWPDQANAPGISRAFTPLQLNPPRMRYFTFNSKRVPMDDARVRHALALLVNRGDFETRGLRFKRLPGFAREADAVVRAWTAARPGEKPERFQGRDFSEDRLAAVRRPRLLYLITHGFFLPDLQLLPADRDRAAELLHQALGVDPMHEEALARYVDHFRERRDWRGLIDLYEFALDNAREAGADADDIIHRLEEIAQLAELRLGDIDRAIEAWNRIAEIEPASTKVTEALRRLTARSKMWQQLVASLEMELDPLTPSLDVATLDADCRYAGYLKREDREVQRVSRYTAQRVPATFSFAGLAGLSTELQQRLTEARPTTVASAGRVPGVTPAALALISAAIARQGLSSHGRADDMSTGEARA